LYDRLFVKENPDDVEHGEDFLAHLNPDSLRILKNCKVEQVLGSAKPSNNFNFERVGYFCADIKESKPNAPVFNRIVTLKDAWTKIEQHSKKISIINQVK